MDIRQFRHFVAVAETLHFGRAAERLGITQPPLSQSIQALEKDLGAALFARTKRHVELTPLGQQWLPHVREALSAIDALPDTARRLRDGQTGYLSLSFVSTADYSVLPDLVRRYAEAFPGVEIQLVEATSDVQVPAVLAGERHAGIIIPPPNRALPAPRVRLCITDALLCQFHLADTRRADYATTLNELWLGTDPVALDMMAADRIVKLRQFVKLPTRIEANEMRRAAGRMGMGVTRLEDVEIIDLPARPSKNRE